MTAKEMFKELGYDEEHTSTHITYYKKKLLFGYKSVTFWMTYKNYDTSDGYEELDVTPELHLAITQQMKELGWL